MAGVVMLEPDAAVTSPPEMLSVPWLGAVY